MIKRFFINTGLLILAIVLLFMFLTSALISLLIKAFHKRQFKSGFGYVSERVFDIAEGVDIFANTVAPELLTYLLSTKESKIPFGIKGETVSLVMGWKKLETPIGLSKRGLWVDKILSKIDPPDHTLKTVDYMTKDEFIENQYQMYLIRKKVVNETSNFRDPNYFPATFQNSI